MSVTDASDEEIAEALMKLVEDEVELGTFVVLEGDIERNYYVQFALDGGRLYCEAVSNQYLEPPNELSDAQLRTLENLGWREPEHRAQNWFRTFRPTRAADYAEIVALARRAFVEVYGLAPDRPLVMTRSWDDDVPDADTDTDIDVESERDTPADERLGSDTVLDPEHDPVTVDERVELYLEELDVRYLTNDAMVSLVARLADDVAVNISVSQMTGGNSVVSFVVPLLLEVSPDDARIAPLAEWTRDHAIGALAYVDSAAAVTVEHRLLGDFLDREEMSEVLRGLAEAVGDWRVRLLAGVTGAVPPRFSELESAR